jgi:3D (Asp-Asp-Asp) domain-containing protein
MSYSRSTKRKKDFAKRIIISWVIVFILGLLLGTGTGILIGKATSKDEPVETVLAAEPNFFTEKVQEVEPITTKPEEIEPIYLGNYRITAYCACKKCCGVWAENRPNGIVKGAAGVELKAGVSVASPLPFGTKLYIEGYGDVVVQDRTASWVVDKYNGEIIDIYFDSHEEALNFGVRYADVYKIESEVLEND